MTLSYGRCDVTLGRAAIYPISTLSTGQSIQRTAPAVALALI